VNASILTENHGVPGSNPGPATQESPANHREAKMLWTFAKLVDVQNKQKAGIALLRC
jgi:hypothetical protein